MRTLQTTPTAVQIKMSTPVGPVFLVASEKGLQGLFWEQQKAPLIKPTAQNSIAKVLVESKNQLNEYFTGKRTDFDLPFDFQGTAFQKKVWNQLMKIPFGETRSYAWVAEKIKSPSAVRAVGTANGKNPLCIIVPCHRVISKDGTLGGYSGGLNRKMKLLKLESN